MASLSKHLHLTAAVVASVIASGAACYWFQVFDKLSRQVLSTAAIRRKLPRNLDEWRIPGESDEADEAVWQDLPVIFAARGYTFWSYDDGSILRAPPSPKAVSGGFGYATTLRGLGPQIGSVQRMFSYVYMNPMTRAAYSSDGRSVVIRVLRLNDEGETHLRILRKLATGPLAFFSTNHTLPMLDEVHLEDVVFGVFPRVGAPLRVAWAKNSVGDVLNMIMQALEALAFIHSQGVAHRDAFMDNFLIQWHPESLSVGSVAVSQPRVYLHDFEVAIDFEPNCSVEERHCTGLPLGGSFSLRPDAYSRPIPPEVASGKPYDPCKLDVWQLGFYFAEQFKSGAPQIDAIILSMTHPDPFVRPSASGALEKLSEAIAQIPPRQLLTLPIVNEGS